MQRKRLGASALEVSEICLGTMTWGEQNTESEAHAQIEWALERGINFIDTAEMYPVPPRRETQGSTERILGSWLGRNKAQRGRIVLAAAEAYRAIAKKHGMPLAGIALAFAKNRFFVASTIIGATSRKQLEELAGFFDFKLSKEIQAEIESINAVYPSPCAQ